MTFAIPGRRAAAAVRQLLPGAPVEVGQTPSEVLWRRDKVRLLRYANPRVTRATPVLLVMSVITRSYILDLRPGDSVVAQLLASGYDVYLVDWGVPDVSDSQNTMETYVDGYLPTAIDEVRTATGGPPVALLGYCLGALLALLCTASHPDLAVDRLVLVAPPVDFDRMGLPVTLLRTGIDPSVTFDDTGNVPARLMLDAFRLRSPTAEVSQWAKLAEHLDHDDYVRGHRALSRWIHDHIPMPGALACQMADVLVGRNQLMNGDLWLGGRPRSLANVRCPVLSVVAERDDLVPIAAAEPLRRLLTSADVDELHIEAGHVAMLTGRTGRTVTVPAIAEWLGRRRVPDRAPAGDGLRPTVRAAPTGP